MTAKDLLLASAPKRDGLIPVALPMSPDLDGKVFVRTLTAAERYLFGSAAVQAKDAGTFVSDFEIVAICACEADGTPMFHERLPDGSIKLRIDDLQKLRGADGRIVNAIAVEALKHAGMDAAAPERAKKNSPTPSSSESSSGSP